jgi:hypothetical protein
MKPTLRQLWQSGPNLQHSEMTYFQFLASIWSFSRRAFDRLFPMFLNGCKLRLITLLLRQSWHWRAV